MADQYFYVPCADRIIKTEHGVGTATVSFLLLSDPILTTTLMGSNLQNIGSFAGDKTSSKIWGIRSHISSPFQSRQPPTCILRGLVHPSTQSRTREGPGGSQPSSATVWDKKAVSLSGWIGWQLSGGRVGLCRTGAELGDGGGLEVKPLSEPSLA